MRLCETACSKTLTMQIVSSITLYKIKLKLTNNNNSS